MASPQHLASPDGASSPVPETWLSPRSKLEALLATVESSSEDDGSPAKNASHHAPESPSPANRETPEPPNPVGLGAAESSDEEAVVLPRGRLASRMAAKQTDDRLTRPNLQDDARARVKAMLAAEETQDEVAPDAVVQAERAADASQEEEAVTRPRKILSRREQRSETPNGDNATPAGSPGLFVSPALGPSGNAEEDPGREDSDDSDDELPAAPFKNARFQALVAKKREERKARDAEEARKKAARLATQGANLSDLASDDDGSVSDITDDEDGRKLTQDATRPVRKASRRALEEMNRETQRMTRSLQLAHEAKTRKKVTKASLFERFNFRVAKSPKGKEVAAVAGSSSGPATPVSAHQTDADMRDAETPPSSPPTIGKGDSGKMAQAAGAVIFHEEEISGMTAERADKGKGRAVEEDLEHADSSKASEPKRTFRVKLPVVSTNSVTVDSDSDDLQIVTGVKKTKADAIFDRVPAIKAREPTSMRALRYLAHLDSPERKKPAAGKDDKTAMTASELQASLQQRARLQAKLERERRLELLRSKGIHVQTVEEREREMAQVEDIVARARQEADELMQREKEISKREKQAAGEVDPLAWDDSEDDEDDDFREPEEVSDIEHSGSEDEEEVGDDEDDEDDDDDDSGSDGDAEDEGDGQEDLAKSGLIDDEADPASESADDEAEEGFGQVEDEQQEEDAPAKIRSRRDRKKVITILTDDEDDMDHIEATPRPKPTLATSPAINSDSPNVPTSVLRSASKTFIPGLPVPVAAPAGLGLTQIFAGTMDDSQPAPTSGVPDEPMPTFDNFPDSNFSQTAREDAVDIMIVDSQKQETQGVQLTFSQSQMQGMDSLLRAEATQLSELLQPTQDEGFQNYSPLKTRFVEPPPPPPSTVETVVLTPTPPAEEVQDTQPVQKKGRLRRRADLSTAFEEEEQEKAEEVHDADPDFEIEEDEFGFGTTNAFKVLKTASRKAQKERLATTETFDKKKSKAKEMVEDQAEESEDEYAGLGGVDGEDSDDSDAGSVKEMIDDDAKGNAVDNGKLAAFYADGERARDEKQVEKLFRDITTGLLRRKRGADYDLSDSDDGGEARRRMKRRQFAKMQRALFADERIEKIAENPRNMAFLRSIEDRGSDGEMDLVMDSPPVQFGQGQETVESSQGLSQGLNVAVPDSQPTAIVAAGPAASLRRTRDRKKPANLGEIRESLSTLLEEPNHGTIPATDPHSAHSDDSDADAGDAEPAEPPRAASGSAAERNKENNDPHDHRPKTRHHPATTVAVVDRITLKRNGSSASLSSNGSTTSIGTTQRLAFAASSSTAQGPFKVPALLRRATTNSLISTTSSTSSSSSSKENRRPGGGASGSGSGSGFGEEAKIKRGGGKRSGVNYFARETERRAALAEGEKRREARRWKGAEGRGKAVGGLFGGGRFE